MSYDLNILSINQEKPAKLLVKSSIEIRNEIDSSNPLRYNSIWPFMCGTKGIWYCLGKEEDGLFNAMSIVDTDLDKELEKEYRPYWILDEEVLSNLSQLVVLEEYREEFERVIEFLIQQSPSKSIMFLARYQGGDKEIIHGVIKHDEFIELLRKSKILFNVCYIISE